jgi:hypothetical protein
MTKDPHPSHNHPAAKSSAAGDPIFYFPKMDGQLVLNEIGIF